MMIVHFLYFLHSLCSADCCIKCCILFINFTIVVTCNVCILIKVDSTLHSKVIIYYMKIRNPRG